MSKTDQDAIWEALHFLMTSLQKLILATVNDGLDHVGRIYGTPEDMMGEFTRRTQGEKAAAGPFDENDALVQKFRQLLKEQE